MPKALKETYQSKVSIIIQYDYEGIQIFLWKAPLSSSGPKWSPRDIGYKRSPQQRVTTSVTSMRILGFLYTFLLGHCLALNDHSSTLMMYNGTAQGEWMPKNPIEMSLTSYNRVKRAVSTIDYILKFGP